MLNPFNSPFNGPYYLVSYLTKWIALFTKADLMIVQSEDAKRTFNGLGCDTTFTVCSGVDVNRYVPVSDGKKNELREKYRISNEKFVVLHVGSIRKWRNIEVLKELQDIPNVQVVVIGRTSTKYEKNLGLELEMRGCKLINEYFPKIEEIYALSDCYVFPTTNPVGSIDIPLSVLEAMSTNLPVVTTKFGGLPNIFGEKNGFVYSDAGKFANIVYDIMHNGMDVRTRDMVLAYSWENTATRLEHVYERLLL